MSAPHHLLTALLDGPALFPFDLHDDDLAGGLSPDELDATLGFADLAELADAADLVADPDEPADVPDLGPCCRCGGPPQPLNPVRTVVTLTRERPAGAGAGWGCVVCELPMRGAVAALCDLCVQFLEDMLSIDPLRDLTTYCTGEDNRGRAPIAELSAQPRFEHDLSKHVELECQLEACR